MLNNFPTLLQVRMAHDRGPLGRLFARAGRKEDRNSGLQRLLPTELAGHCLGIERQDDTLCLVMESAAWAARARYAIPGLQEPLLQACEPPARKLRVRAARDSAPPSPRNRPSRDNPPKGGPRMSAHSRSHVRDAARHIADPELREALERLARDQDTSD